MTTLAVSGLRAPFGREAGLHGVSFEVRAGERLAVLGASGAGKTTLLRAIAGLAPVTAGTIAVRGRDVAGEPPERRDVVYLHQTPTLFPHLSVFENVAFPLRVRRIGESEVRGRVATVLHSVMLQDLARRPISTLSGGQRHRVALARAIAARPAVLLLDEPLSSLDPPLREDVRQAIIAVQAYDRPAIVLVTHDVDEAGILADRIGVLVDGSIAQIAPPAELFSRPASLEVARFLGFPNRIDGTVSEDGRFHSPLGAFRPTGATSPGPATAVCQPEAVSVDAAGAPGRVVAVRHRLRAPTAVVAVGHTTLEIAVVGPAPAAGDEIRVSLDPARVTVFPRDPSPGAPGG